MAPTESNVFAPLLSTAGSNAYLAFSGTNDASGNPKGPHVLSAFDIQWADTGLSNGAEIQFRLLAGVNEDFPTQEPAILWEIDGFQVDGVRLCAVPEPGTVALAGCAVAAALASRRLRRSVFTRRSFFTR